MKYDIDVRVEIAFQIDMDSLKEISYLYTNKDIELIIVDNSEIKKINSEFRNIDKATDVLSFPITSSGIDDEILNQNMPLGSIIISQDFIKDKAENFKHSLEDEFKLLFIHGLLHLVGFDHEIDNGEMREEERKIITKFNLPESLIIRNY
jgi:probable rRNA maturation factor